MARGKSRPKKTPEQRLIDAAMERAQEDGWRGTDMAAIAAAADMPLIEALKLFPRKTAILLRIGELADQAVVDESADDGEMEESPKDRLFDILMRRYDALMPYKNGLAAITRELSDDPIAGACLLCAGRRSMAKMLKVANLDPVGIKGLIRTKGLLAIHLNSMRTWFRDDSPDMSATMANLDRDLSRADKIITTINGCRATQPSHPA